MIKPCRRRKLVRLVRVIRRLLSVACWASVVSGTTSIITELARGSMPYRYSAWTLFALVCAMAMWPKPKREAPAGEKEPNS